MSTLTLSDSKKVQLVIMKHFLKTQTKLPFQVQQIYEKSILSNYGAGGVLVVRREHVEDVQREN